MHHMCPKIHVYYRLKNILIHLIVYFKSQVYIKYGFKIKLWFPSHFENQSIKKIQHENFDIF